MTNAVKHTPGPWTAKMSKWHEESLLVQAGMPSNRILARFGSSDEPLDDTDRANAQLIAAAPELLSALEACVSSMHGDHPGDNSYWRAVETAEAIIAKARGC